MRKPVIFGTGESVYGWQRNSGRRVCLHGIGSGSGGPAARAEGFRRAVELLGGLDVLVNAAGIQRRYPSPEFPLEEWDRVLEINLTAPFDLSQRAAREFLKKDEPYGKIINVASMLSFFGGFTVPAYAASKGRRSPVYQGHGQRTGGPGNQHQRHCPGVHEHGDEHGAPGPGQSPFEEISRRIPAHRWGTPQDMKGAAVFLASHASDYLSGAVIPVDGGYLVN